MRRCCAAPLRTATQRKATSHGILLQFRVGADVYRYTRPYWYLARVGAMGIWIKILSMALRLVGVNGIWQEVEPMHGNEDYLAAFAEHVGEHHHKREGALVALGEHIKNKRNEYKFIAEQLDEMNWWGLIAS